MQNLKAKFAILAILLSGFISDARGTENPCKELNLQSFECLKHPEYTGDQRINCNRTRDEQAKCIFSLGKSHPDLSKVEKISILRDWHKLELEATLEAKKVCDAQPKTCDEERTRMNAKRIRDLPKLIERHGELIKRLTAK